MEDESLNMIGVAIAVIENNVDAVKKLKEIARCFARVQTAKATCREY